MVIWRESGYDSKMLSECSGPELLEDSIGLPFCSNGD